MLRLKDRIRRKSGKCHGMGWDTAAGRKGTVAGGLVMVRVGALMWNSARRLRNGIQGEGLQGNEKRCCQI
ncbi:hypothetical protein E2C01_080458 [Portunus trituberculatus]|uniref:Uncharacterized protein n=1 Tax=Portunus trituberculatus TaxID=210409 RepID=A0A5B7ITB4_PORTR|nr:hypothetical protein [Portunus trituberculatus]